MPPAALRPVGVGGLGGTGDLGQRDRSPVDGEGPANGDLARRQFGTGRNPTSVPLGTAVAEQVSSGSEPLQPWSTVSLPGVSSTVSSVHGPDQQTSRRTRSTCSAYGASTVTATPETDPISVQASSGGAAGRQDQEEAAGAQTRTG